MRGIMKRSVNLAYGHQNSQDRNQGLSLLLQQNLQGPPSKSSLGLQNFQSIYSQAQPQNSQGIVSLGNVAPLSTGLAPQDPLAQVFGQSPFFTVKPGWSRYSVKFTSTGC